MSKQSKNIKKSKILKTRFIPRFQTPLPSAKRECLRQTHFIVLLRMALYRLKVSYKA